MKIRSAIQRNIGEIYRTAGGIKKTIDGILSIQGGILWNTGEKNNKGVLNSKMRNKAEYIKTKTLH